jgi:hypothetical protein
MTPAGAAHIGWVCGAHEIWSYGLAINLQCSYDIEHDWLWQRLPPSLPRRGCGC